MHLAQLGNPNAENELQDLVAVGMADFVIHLMLKISINVLQRNREG